ncbi:MAG: hypothetical protein ABI716_02270 [Candidatus Saccharibacteria bacterium]
MFKKYQGKLYCFSPPVMLATFLIEFGFAFYTLWRYKLNSVSRLAFVMLISLGTFQLAEFMVCGGLGLTHMEWARVGYGALTLLPALGIHMVVSLAGKKKPLLVNVAYASGVAFAAYYLVSEGAVTGSTCYANYAVFHVEHASVWPFALYYYGWMLTGTNLAFRWASQLPKRRKALQAMAMGYLVFVLPTTMFNLVDPSTMKAIPSIMCGFAVLLAFVVVFRVLPVGSQVRGSVQGIRLKLRI